MDDATWVIACHMGRHDYYYAGDGLPWATDLTQARRFTDADAESFMSRYPHMPLRAADVAGQERDCPECRPNGWNFTDGGLFACKGCGGSGRVN
jgi:hypothetical protein